MFQSIKDFISKWYFLISAAGLALLYFLFDKRGQTIRQLHEDVQIAKLGEKLEGLKERAQQSDEKFKESADQYNDLKRKHPELFAKLGIGCNPKFNKENKPE